eukprot:GHVS01019867.1.p1 GENE.GHVS01019867.1~~GHVS01019867.1.p1  ORF type:complete len:406 (-),score=44.46 GHVS01019867.1:1007-2224(-)
MSSCSALVDLACHRRAVFASRFLRPPARCKRAELREKPRRKIGPFENPVRRFVRLREKARLFSEIPPPRRIPIPKPTCLKFLKQVSGVPAVLPEVLQRRLDFYLLCSERAKDQQLHAKLRRGVTPYQAELFMWERQLRDIRKIYRAQYLQKLSEVTEEERVKQMDLYQQEKQERVKRKAEIQQRMYEDKKRRAILKDRMRIERKVTQSVEFSRLSRRKKFQLLHVHRIQGRSKILLEDNLELQLKDRKQEILSRNVLAGDLLNQLGHKAPPGEPKHKFKQSLNSVDNMFREIMEESFKLLPEDESPYEEPSVDPSELTQSQRAHVMYSGFSASDKLKLLDEKIDMLTEKIDKETQLTGSPGNLLFVQLKDQLEAAKQAYLEKSYRREAEGRAKKGLHDDDDDKQE